MTSVGGKVDSKFDWGGWLGNRTYLGSLRGFELKFLYKELKLGRLGSPDLSFELRFFLSFLILTHMTSTTYLNRSEINSEIVTVLVISMIFSKIVG